MKNNYTLTTGKNTTLTFWSMPGKSRERTENLPEKRQQSAAKSLQTYGKPSRKCRNTYTKPRENCANDKAIDA